VYMCESTSSYFLSASQLLGAAAAAKAAAGGGRGPRGVKVVAVARLNPFLAAEVRKVGI
jgi:hypothetical protein